MAGPHCPGSSVLRRCQPAWREVAINTRYLWSKFRVSICSCGLERDSDERWGNIVKLWLSRSRGLPLSVSVLVDTERGATDNAVTTVIAALIKFSESWESIHLEIPFDYLSSTLLANLKASNLPILRSVSISSVQVTLSKWAGNGTIHVLQTIPAWSISKAPSLQRLHLLHGVVTSTLLDKWSQIIDLRVKGCDIAVEHCYGILSGCKKLQTCFLDNYDPSSVVNTAVQFRSVQLKHLTSLVLYERTLLPILFDVPSLRRFEYQGMFIRNLPSPIPHLLLSARDLESLHIDPKGINLEELLELTPSIKNLVFSERSRMFPPLCVMFHYGEWCGVYQGVNDKIIRRLTSNNIPLGTAALVPNYRYLCPALESLVCKKDSLRTFTDEVLLTFIKKRREESLITGGNAAELKEVPIHSKPAPVLVHSQYLVTPATNPTFLANFIDGELVELVRRGMKFHLPDCNLKLE